MSYKKQIVQDVKDLIANVNHPNAKIFKDIFGRYSKKDLDEKFQYILFTLLEGIVHPYCPFVLNSKGILEEIEIETTTYVSNGQFITIQEQPANLAPKFLPNWEEEYYTRKLKRRMNMPNVDVTSLNKLVKELDDKFGISNDKYIESRIDYEMMYGSEKEETPAERHINVITGGAMLNEINKALNKEADNVLGKKKRKRRKKKL